MNEELLVLVQECNARYQPITQVSEEPQPPQSLEIANPSVGVVSHRMTALERDQAIELLEVIEMEHLLNQNITLASYAESLKRMLVDQRERSKE